MNRRPRSTVNDRELRLWKVGWALGLAFAAAILAAGGIFYSLVELLDFKEIDSTSRLDAKTLFDLVKLSFGVVAGAGALVALVVAYRRQRVDEAGAHREATRLHTERFSQAVDKLGSDSPAVRLGGVHALAGLADDAPDDNLRQTCIDVLCAYLRLPFSPDPGDLLDPLPDGTSPSEERRDAHQAKKDRYHAFREVRHTILRLIGDHYRIPEGTHRSWQGCNLDLTRVTLDSSVNFSGATFSGGMVTFNGATFSGGMVTFNGATFSDGIVTFNGATFSGGSVSLISAKFSGSSVTFNGATFSSSSVTFNGATFSDGIVTFGGATFSGGMVNFNGAEFSGGMVTFSGATFSGGSVTFNGATFSGGSVTFSGATFSGGSVSFVSATFSDGIVSFVSARFSGGSVTFISARFSCGSVTFGSARFSGSSVDFGSATFSGSSVDFGSATFSDGIVSFVSARFSDGMVDFISARFSDGSVTFNGAEFSGGSLGFQATTGPVPVGLLAAVGTPVLSTVRLRADWLPSVP
ncbi:pentapeptide repeat-containing protein [Streptomyces sp. NPDC060005]|uniref:pentapeptide repeat-containing protein n=1 Tax=Streptomyces sp. NPDC060005 TaxID=3347034 RepID=UPI0036747DF9